MKLKVSPPYLVYALVYLFKGVNIKLDLQLLLLFYINTLEIKSTETVVQQVKNPTQKHRVQVSVVLALKFVSTYTNNRNLILSIWTTSTAALLVADTNVF